MSLACPMATQFANHRGGQSHRARPHRSWVLVPNALDSLFGAFNNGELSCVQIHVAPAQRGDFTSPQSTKDRQHRWNEHARSLEGFQQICGLAHVISVEVPALDPGRNNCLGRIAGYQLPPERLDDACFQNTVHVMHRAA